MELKDILETNLKAIDGDKLQSVYETLSKIDVDSIPKKQLKKTFTVVQTLLKVKANEVEHLRAAVNADTDDVKDLELKTLQDENEKIKKTINKLESDKAMLKTRIRDLAEDMSVLRKRLEASNASDKDDSSDILSDLDRKEELLKNINAKNKHIKRLLRDIESLEKKTIEQSNLIVQLNENVYRLEHEISKINEKYNTVNDENQQLNDFLTKSNEELENQAKIIELLENERERTDKEFKAFVNKLEEKAYAWRKILDDKESQLDSMRKKYEELYLKHPNGNDDVSSTAEFKNLVEAVQERDCVISELENKLRVMAQEMMTSTQLMNKISQERETFENKAPIKNKVCCKDLETALEHANKRCRDLSEMLDTIEEDNAFKSKHAEEAIAALKTYEKGKDGLPQALQKIGQLQQKLISRDTQIKAMVMEINSLHEIAQENLILRKKLNIPEDAIISTSNHSAKQKSKDKLISRLSSKLRASEEMRLNLKLEINELRKKNSIFKTHPTPKDVAKQIEETDAKCYNISDPIYCTNCLKLMKSIPDKDNVIQELNIEWESKYSSVIEENENLRVGMHEILERIREYDTSSDHITIDCTILEKVLHALDARSISGWYHPAMRMQNELIALKEREQALKEQINIAERAAIKQSSLEGEMTSIGTQKQDVSGENVEAPIGNQNQTVDVNNERKGNDSPLIIDKSQSLYPIIVEKDIQYDFLQEKLLDVSQKYRDTLLENEKLKCFEALYEEIKSQLESSENQITQYCAVLVDKMAAAETKLNQCESKYGFLKEDFDRVLKELHNVRLSNNAVIADLKKQIINKSISESKLGKQLQPNLEGHVDDGEYLKREVATLKIQLAHLTNYIISESIELKKLDGIETSFMKYGIIKDDFNIDYITCQEYDKLQSEQGKLSKNVEQLTQQCNHLEKLLSVAEEQIKSQQKQLTDLTDNQVNLRHLVADLQSSNEERFIIAKAHRDIEIARDEIGKLKADKQELETQTNSLRSALKDAQLQIDKLESKCKDTHDNAVIKLTFLKKSLFILQGKYCKYTPLILISDFLITFAVQLKKTNEARSNIDDLTNITEGIVSKFKLDSCGSETETIIKAIKSEAQCRLLEEKNKQLNDRVISLETDFRELKLSTAADKEHWNTIYALFNETLKKSVISYADKMTQHEFEQTDASTNTNSMPEIKPNLIEDTRLNIKTTDVALSCPSSPSIQYSKVLAVRSLESQLKQAMSLASNRSALLLEAENKLAESQGRVKEMERIIEEKNSIIKQHMDKVSLKDDSTLPRRSSLVESTITSLQALLTEKDTTLSHYQELLKTEREQHAKSCENYEKELEVLQIKCVDVENKIKSKTAEIVELTAKMTSLERRAAATQLETQDEMKQLEDSDSNFNEISDEKIEEMFLDDNKQLSQELLHGASNLEFNDEPLNRYIHQLQTRLQEADEREKLWQNNAKTRDEEINVMKEKLLLLEGREKLEVKSAPESEQLQALLEEKDKHINDLLETLSSFHDDQQRFINETSLYSADQVTQLGADLTRSETTNRILSAQLDALRRQVSNLTVREKQARELANSLRNQLIKRPVVSVKTELNTRAKQEQLQKRLQTLEIEIEDLRKENKRMAVALEEKRAKNANDLALWDKQKRWQQSAEKLKSKLNETESSLEKTRIMLNAAKTTINRLEKEKSSLETRLRGAGTSTVKCCRTPSCPNLLMKYCMSETPDTCTTGSECNSPEHRDHSHKIKFLEMGDANAGIINALKSRVESQQRRIVALELERKGSNALTTELEKTQEKLATIEAQNIRLEAKNLQLQLDIDLLRQGDEKERLHKRIKYLEDYVLALKEELAHFEAQKDMSSGEGKFFAHSLSHPEQTILSLRRIIERLRVDNKNLRENRNSFEKRDVKGGGDLVQELQAVREKLKQKTQLLEKAKILLTRAAAKEKNLKEQLTIWKRKCSELQNVPVIDEISE